MAVVCSLLESMASLPQALDQVYGTRNERPLSQKA